MRKNDFILFIFSLEINHCTKVHTCDSFLTLTENIKIYRYYDTPDYLIIVRYKERIFSFFVNNSNYEFPYTDRFNQIITVQNERGYIDLNDENVIKLISDLRELSMQEYNESK